MSAEKTTKRTYQEVMQDLQDRTADIINQVAQKDRKDSSSVVSNVYSRLCQIEEKQRCLRVRLLDWLSDSFHNMGERFHQMSVRISSPCAIKLPEKPKTAMDKLRLKPAKNPTTKKESNEIY